MARELTNNEVRGALERGAGLLDYAYQGGVYVAPLVFGEGVVVIRPDNAAFWVPAEDIHMEPDELTAFLLGSVRAPARVIGRAFDVVPFA